MNNEERAQRRAAAEALRARAVPLWVVPCHQRSVRDFIDDFHRNHGPPVGDLFRVACVDEEGRVRGVGTAGRPVGRGYDDGQVLEIARVATDGTVNACSMIYAALRRCAFALGYRRVVTYTLPEEGGASLRAAGFTHDGLASPPNWRGRPGRAVPKHGRKVRWLCDNPRSFVGDIVWPEVEDDDGQVVMFGGER